MKVGCCLDFELTKGIPYLVLTNAVVPVLPSLLYSKKTLEIIHMSPSSMTRYCIQHILTKSEYHLGFELPKVWSLETNNNGIYGPCTYIFRGVVL